MHTSALLVLGVGLMFVGLGFKVVAAPFQIYAPDVYEGAPTPVTALLASAPKAATFALMLRIFYTSFSRRMSGSGRSGFVLCFRCSSETLPRSCRTT